MSTTTQLGRYLGGAVAVLGLAMSAAFLGPRTADPLASSVIDPLTLWVRLLGILAGLVVIAVGLTIVGRAGDDTHEENVD